jgi:hypothetical protein
VHYSTQHTDPGTVLTLVIQMAQRLTLAAACDVCDHAYLKCSIGIPFAAGLFFPAVRKSLPPALAGTD